MTIEIKGPGGGVAAHLTTPGSIPAPAILLCTEPEMAGVARHAIARLCADEGYTVLAPEALGSAPLSTARAAIETLRKRHEVAGGIAVIGHGRACRVAVDALVAEELDCAVLYDPESLDELGDALGRFADRCLVHVAGATPVVGGPETDAGKRPIIIGYPDTLRGFAVPGTPHYDKRSALLAHQRSIAAIRRRIGPHYDFSALWDRHCECEFDARDVDSTMRTMVDEPYVNHIPTMTGGVGQAMLHHFYAHHFIPRTPADTRLVPVSRTVGEGILVDELLFCFTHDIEIDWMLPGIPPTGRYVEIPLVAIVKFRGDKLYNEHIYWDQASVLVQIGKLDPTGLPIAGIETARKLLDETLPSNQLMANWRGPRTV